MMLLCIRRHFPTHISIPMQIRIHILSTNWFVFIYRNHRLILIQSKFTLLNESTTFQWKLEWFDTISTHYQRSIPFCFYSFQVKKKIIVKISTRLSNQIPALKALNIQLMLCVLPKCLKSFANCFPKSVERIETKIITNKVVYWKP